MASWWKIKINLFDPKQPNHVRALQSLIEGENLERFVLCPPRMDMPCFSFLVSGSRLYGSVDIFDIDARLRSAQLGVWMKNAPIGTGVRAVRQVLGLVFSLLPVRRIEARIRASNDKVIALAQRFGFRLEGRLRLAAGDEDVFVFGLLADEFYQKWGR